MMYFEIFAELDAKGEHSGNLRGNFREAIINANKRGVLVIPLIFKRYRDEGF